MLRSVVAGVFVVCLAVAAAGTLPEGSSAAGVVPRWTQAGEPGIGAAMTAFAIDPSNPNHVVMGGELQGIAYSFDRGVTWTPSEGLSSPEIGDITFGSSGVIWAGTYGGPAKSVDGGRTFTMVSSWPRSTLWHDPQEGANRRVEKVLVDPANNNHLFAFCGNQRDLGGHDLEPWFVLQPDGSFYNASANKYDYPPPSDGEVYESVDGGVTWTIKGQITGSNIKWAGIDSAANFVGSMTNMLIGSNMGLFRSTNSGATWQRVYSGRARSVTTHPTDPNKAWAATDNGVIVTTNGGVTWQLVPNLPNLKYSIVAVAPSNPSVLWTTMGFPIEASAHTIYRSLDGGANWAQIGLSGYESIYGSGTDFVNGIAIDPTDANRVIGMNFEDVIETTNGGATFHSIVADHLPSGKWRGRGFAGAFGTWVGFSENNPNLLSFAGMDGFNPLVSADAGQSFTRPPASTNDDLWFGAVQTDYQPDDVLWTLRGNWYWGFNGVVRVAGGGEGSGQLFGAGGLPAEGLTTSISLVALTNGAIANVDGILYRSTDAGANWANSTPCPDAGRLVRAWKSWTHIYLGCQNYVMESINAGVTWSVMPGSPGVGGREHRLSSGPQGLVAAHRFDSTRIEVFTGGVWRTIAMPFPGVPGFMAAAMDAGNANRIVAVPYTDTELGQTPAPGPVMTEDGGATWKVIKDGLPVYHFHSLSADPNRPGVFIAGASGGGFYKLDLSGGTVPPTTTSIPTTTTTRAPTTTVPPTTPAPTTTVPPSTGGSPVVIGTNSSTVPTLAAGGSVVGGYPAGSISGDLIIASVMTHGGEVVTTPTGWSLVGFRDVGSSYGARVTVLAKVRGSETSQSFTVPGGAGSGVRVDVMAVRGAGPVSAVSGAGYLTSLDLSTVAVGPTLLLGIAGSGNGTPMTWGAMTSIATTHLYPVTRSALAWAQVPSGSTTRTLSTPYTENIAAFLVSILAPGSTPSTTLPAPTTTSTTILPTTIPPTTIPPTTVASTTTSTTSTTSPTTTTAPPTNVGSPSIVATSSATAPNVAAGDAVSVAYPAGSSSGDVMIASVMTHKGETVSLPSGWSTVGVRDPGAAYEARVAVFSRIRGAETSAAFVVPGGAPNGVRVEIVGVRGGGAVTALSDVTYGTSLALSMSVPASSLLVGIAGSGNGTPLTWNAMTPISTTHLYPLSRSALAWSLTPGSSQVATQVVTAPYSENITAFLVSVAPAPVVPPSTGPTYVANVGTVSPTPVPNAGSLSVTYPAASATGDLLVASVMTHGSEIVATPDGWSLVATKDTGVAYQARIAVFAKFKGTDTAQAFTFPIGAPSGARVEVIVVRGATAVDAGTGSGYQSSLGVSVTATAPSLLIGIGSSGNNTPMGWSGMAPLLYTPSYPAPSAAMAYESVGAAVQTRYIAPPYSENIVAVLLAVR